ncbi:UNVERIFIED_ORG: multidrug efflux pump subunit AcrB [Methylobacterium sp. SuP10 SLI 274]|uniref:efflux RND transporter permease subunit n=1 Tax=Methylorubrum extorquens TaxID=408 RepID=UPI00209CFEF7|nr:efflux RND transporter permease subunit [Methylorubrum extorquens]MCP1558509.1 multidrug efflux pump subunit AcrB [Methylorubrum extorquens]MDF9863821.1 multidrug efflux pump subunit AcrB [Methylorubrum pseudosasae]MDH6637421.1 multidrug efflux pump subunit AcrB [Methylobacterium sp. SuP10 SLI 274]MDH6666599.1 multidrug efflux pump subunit AcrB [Methylorubrum zatmanii]
MGLVQYALKFRITTYVLAVLMMLGGVSAIVVTPKDVLPAVDIPVVVVVWTYTGLSAPEMEKRITTYSEFGISNNVNNIARMESTSLQGTSVMKIYFDQSVSIDLAIAQVVSSTNSIRALMPPGVQPPVIVRFSASSVPVIQLALTSAKDSLNKVYDYAQYRIRQRLTQVPGSTLPSPFGGAPRQVMVDLDLHALQALGMTPLEVTNAVTSQNLTIPSGLAKIGEQQYPVQMNATPDAIAALNEIPIKVVNGQPVLVRDVAYVRDGGPPQVNVVRADGAASVLMRVLKNGTASTLDVVNNVKAALPDIRAAAPEGMEIKPLFDQSVFVSNAIEGVWHEAVIAAALTGLTILLFLGSWRSTLIVLVSIPLCLMTSLALLAALGHTINVMTLGGLALAVGILVDDVTVAIENTYRLFEEGKPFRNAVVEGAAGIAKPALISTLSICAAFVSVFALTDTPKYLFTPQALAVVFAMLTSYLLTRTLVPVMIDVLVAREYLQHHGGEANAPRRGRIERALVWLLSPVFRLAGAFRRGFEARFDRFLRGYVGLLHAVLRHPVATVTGVVLLFAGTGGLFVFTGQDYFPQVESSQMTMHLRTRPGMRIETAEQTFAEVEKVVREVIPEDEIDQILDNIGLPSNNYNFAFSDGSFVSYNDGQMLIDLKDEHGPVAEYQRRLREILRERFPDMIVYFQPSDIITQILNFGVIAQIDVQVAGRNTVKDLAAARRIEARLKETPGLVDVHLHQIVDQPQFFVDVDRRLASELGLTQQQVAQSLNVSLSGSFQVNPNFWTDPKTGIPYQLWVQTPEYRNASLTALQNTPLFARANAGSGPGALTLLSSIATITRQPTQTVINHVNTQPTFNVYAAVQDRDLGAVARDIDRIVAEEQKTLPAPDKISVRGQIENMRAAFFRLGIGLGIAVVAVYLLMAVNYQSWGDPFVVLAALPIAFCGIVASLFITGTAFSIPSLFGAIMSVGIASANSILLVTFAKEHREATGCSAREAAIVAGETRLRPVLMTASAMFLGLVPMALGTGEGGEQNAALARAVMGGIALGTPSTLLFVPFLYSLLRRGEAKPLEDYV